MKQWYVNVNLPTGNRTIVVYAATRKDATKVFQQQWGAAFNNNYSIDSIFEAVKFHD